MAWIETRTKTFRANVAVEEYLRVKLSAGKVVVAGATDQDAIGVTERAALVANDPVSVWLNTAQGTVTMHSTGTVAVGAVVYAAADGKVAAAGSVVVGRALTATGASGGHLEVLMDAQPAVGFTAAAATPATVSALGIPQHTIIASVAGAQTVNIPGGDVVPPGAILTVKKTGSAGAATLTPADGTIAGGATYTALDAQNDFASFYSDGTNWVLLDSNIA